MKVPKLSWKKFMGRNEDNDKKVSVKRDQAHDIKNEMAKDVLRIQRKVDNINAHTYQKLFEISQDLGSVTYKIGIATGGKRRGLK